MKKKIGYALLILVVLSLSTGFYFIRKFNNAFFKEKSFYLTYEYEPKPIHFEWAANTIGSHAEEEPIAAMVFPVKIDGLAHQFHMQFDTGSPHSFLYENDIKSLQALGLKLKEVKKGEERFVEHIAFRLGNNHIKASMVKVLANYGNTFDENDTISKIGIGTIGNDFIANRITAIDFKAQKLTLFNQRPDWMYNQSGFKPFDFTGRRIMLPVQIENNDYVLFYDSGCSAFGLITIKSRFDAYSDPNAKTIAYDAKSWSNSIPVVSKTSSQPMTMGNTTLSLRRVSFIDMYPAMQPLATPFTKIDGWLGNQPFIERTLILDTKKEEFLVY
ncbi:MAG: hypothetical protein AAGA43_05870 [Bacteroidota bacterium]